MGNVLSFPLLCLANLCCFWMAVERYRGVDVDFDDLPPARINGDDILFLAPDDRFYDIWKEEATKFGFELSQGKNLVSDKLLQINSVLYRTQFALMDDPTMIGLDGTFLYDVRPVPFVNFGLITNRKKNDCSIDYSLQRTGLDTRDHTVPTWVHRVSNAPKIVAELVRGLNATLRQRAMALYEDHNRWLRAKLHRLPWDQMFELGRDGNQEGWLVYLQRFFRGIVPNDPCGQIRQDMPTSSLLRRLTPAWEDDDCYDAYRATNVKVIYPRGPEIEKKERNWTTLSLRGRKWKDQTNKERNEMYAQLDACLLYAEYVDERDFEYPEFGDLGQMDYVYHSDNGENDDWFE